MEENSSVCLNNGKPTRIVKERGGMSCLDITIVSASFACKCILSVSKYKIGSDHFSVTCEKKSNYYGVKWAYNKADWEKF